MRNENSSPFDNSISFAKGLDPMTRYSINSIDQLPYHLTVGVRFTAREKDTIAIIPFWRPGRYEGGNFPKNFIGIKAKADGKPLQTRKLKGNLVHIETEKGDEVELSYQLYTRDLTAGNTYVDDEVLLINPVNACLYIKGMEEAPCQLDLQVPKNWSVSTAMKLKGGSTYRCRDMQHFMDTPVLAARNIDISKYDVNGIPFYIHTVGGFAGSEDELTADFKAFSERQVEVFGSIPVEEYHFLNIFLPHRAYHGVEHENSTVIILGPSDKLNERPLYKELLGVSSHELYHTWNIKYIRPKDWKPYDFTQADYSRLGYVAEGVTTYMGDVMLWQSGVFSDKEYLSELAALLKRHKDNEGRFNLSLADSSIDTWVDGYGRGTPRRRVSIYVEGALLAFVCDVWLLDASNGELSLSDAMRRLYEKAGGEKGYTEEDYWNILSGMADRDWQALRRDVVDGTGRLEAYAKEAMNTLGLSCSETNSPDPIESRFGFKLQSVNGKQVVWNVFSGSPAEAAGLWFDDEVTAINGKEPNLYLSEKDGEASDLLLEINSGFRQKRIELTADGESYGHQFSIEPKGGNRLFDAWKGAKSLIG